eukprot:Colp12_sorted_trinity150504_noHs@35594
MSALRRAAFATSRLLRSHGHDAPKLAQFVNPFTRQIVRNLTVRHKFADITSHGTRASVRFFSTPTDDGSEDSLWKKFNEVDIHSADPNNETPLHEAALLKDPKYVALLLSRGADPMIQNNRGMKAAQVAIESGNEETAIYLLENGTKLNENECLVAGRKAISRFQVKLLEALLLNGLQGDPNLTDDMDKTLLHHAVHKNVPPAVDLLLSYGAKCFQTDRARANALMVAKRLRYEHFVPKLQRQFIRDQYVTASMAFNYTEEDKDATKKIVEEACREHFGVHYVELPETADEPDAVQKLAKAILFWHHLQPEVLKPIVEGEDDKPSPKDQHEIEAEENREGFLLNTCFLGSCRVMTQIEEKFPELMVPVLKLVRAELGPKPEKNLLYAYRLDVPDEEITRKQLLEEERQHMEELIERERARKESKKGASAADDLPVTKLLREAGVDDKMIQTEFPNVLHKLGLEARDMYKAEYGNEPTSLPKGTPDSVIFEKYVTDIKFLYRWQLGGAEQELTPESAMYRVGRLTVREHWVREILKDIKKNFPHLLNPILARIRGPQAGSGKPRRR